MIRAIKFFIKNSSIYQVIEQRREMKKWERNGGAAPTPHLIKQRTIREYADKFGIKVFIETGTYFGYMVAAMKKHFTWIYSIELSDELYLNAMQKFVGDERIKIIHGDSAVELGKLIPNLDQPALFWLDGHYSAGMTAKGKKDTPIYEELTHIFNSLQKMHVIIIDDARCFGTDPAYPNIDELTKFIKTKNPNVKIEIENDCIRITPKKQDKKEYKLNPNNL